MQRKTIARILPLIVLAFIVVVVTVMQYQAPQASETVMSDIPIVKPVYSVTLQDSKGQPVSGVNAHLYPQTDKTGKESEVRSYFSEPLDKEGRADFYAIPSGTYILEFRESDGAEMSVSDTVHTVNIGTESPEEEIVYLRENASVPTPSVPTASPTPLPSSNALRSFTVSPNPVVLGNTVTFSWRTQGATRVELTPGGQVSVNGTKTVKPTQSGTYLLTVTDNLGAITNQAIDVLVVNAAAPIVRAPENLTVAASDVNTVKLAWRDMSTNETGFRILRASGTNAPYEHIATAAARTGQLQTVQYEDTSFKLGDTGFFYYKIQAVSTQSESPISAVVTVELVGATAKVTAPSGFSVTGRTRETLLKWRDESSDEVAYEIFRSENGQTSTSAGRVPANEIRYFDTRLTKGKRYYYYVRAYKEVRGERLYSEATPVQSAIVK